MRIIIKKELPGCNINDEFEDMDGWFYIGPLRAFKPNSLLFVSLINNNWIEIKDENLK